MTTIFSKIWSWPVSNFCEQKLRRQTSCSGSSVPAHGVLDLSAVFQLILVPARPITEQLKLIEPVYYKSIWRYVLMSQTQFNLRVTSAGCEPSLFGYKFFWSVANPTVPGYESLDAHFWICIFFRRCPIKSIMNCTSGYSFRSISLKPENGTWLLVKHYRLHFI